MKKISAIARHFVTKEWYFMSWTIKIYRSEAMSRIWPTEEIAVNRIKIVEETQTLTVSFTKHMTRIGIPTRPDMISENAANEVRNIFVSVPSVFSFGRSRR